MRATPPTVAPAITPVEGFPLLSDYEDFANPPAADADGVMPAVALGWTTPVTSTQASAAFSLTTVTKLLELEGLACHIVNVLLS